MSTTAHQLTWKPCCHIHTHGAFAEHEEIPNLFWIKTRNKNFLKANIQLVCSVIFNFIIISVNQQLNKKRKYLSGLSFTVNNKLVLTPHH